MHLVERASGLSTVRADALARTQRALTRGWVDVVVFTSADLVIEWISPSVHDVGGWHPDELIGRSALSLVHPDDVASVVDTMAGVIDAGLVYDPLDGSPLDPARFSATSLRFACKDGSWADLESRGNTMLGVDGVDGLLFILRDISDRTAVDELLHAIATDASLPMLIHLIESAVRAHLRGVSTSVTLAGAEVAIPQGVAVSPEEFGRAVAAAAVTAKPTNLVLDSGRLRGVWVRPIVDATGSVLATLTIWTADAVEPNAWARVVLDRVVELASIALVRYRESECVRREATCDPLTGLANRRQLDQRLDQLAREPQRPTCTMLYIDLDEFKPVNDRYGHATGDVVLAIIAERLRATARSTDVVARLGGDEFVVVCRGVSNGEEATIVAERIRGELEQPIAVNGTTVTVGASVGWVVIDGSDAMHDIVSRADAAMYRVKQQRRSA